MKKCKNLKCDWMFVEKQDNNVIRIPYVPPEQEESYLAESFQIMPECCRNCSNHPRNGGSGICNCVLPYMTQTGDSSVVSMTPNIGDVEFPKEDQMG